MHYKMSIKDIFKEFDTSYSGITNKEARERLKKYGGNSLKEEKGTSLWKLILHQISSPLIYILFVAALFTVIVGHYIDTAAILLVVIINTIVGFFQEFKAEKAMQALKKLASQKAYVVRGGIEERIDATELVIGDVVSLSAGNKVPADIRLFELKELQIDESMFTGESLPVSKQIETIDKDFLPLADQKNMAFMGTVVTNGRARGIVVRTGENTELGDISKEVESTVKEETPLQRMFTDFSHKVGLVTLVLAGIVFFLGILEGNKFDEILLFSRSLGKQKME